MASLDSIAERISPVCHVCRDNPAKRVRFGKPCTGCKGEGKRNLSVIRQALQDQRDQFIDGLYACLDAFLEKLMDDEP